MLLLVVVGCLNGILEFIAGIAGVRGRNLRTCKVLGIIILVLAVLSLVMSVLTTADIWLNIIGIVLAILYLVGVQQSGSAHVQ